MNERTQTEREQILDGTVSVREVLNFIEQDGYLDLLQASEYVHLSDRYIRHHLGQIPHYRVGSRKLLFKKSELDSWMKQWRERDLRFDEATKLAEEMLAGKAGI